MPNKSIPNLFKLIICCTNKFNFANLVLYRLLVIGVILCFNFTSSYALQGSIGAHDPSSIVKDGNTYYVFTTSDGIGVKYSTDLIKWTDGTSPYTKTIWPVWIKTYAAAFSGTFWAPECIYMNGEFYLYYAAAGSGQCCIGLCTTPSLNNPIWTDRGVVVSSTAATDNTNAIDPDIFFDATGRLWLTYGSWLGGIRMVELDKTTGKPLNSRVYNPCTLYDAENSQVVQHNGYYYMFVNRGFCCLDAKSTYYIQVGRSTSPNSGYSGWRTVLSTSGTFIGPGGLGYFKEDSTEYATFHYYDGNLNGWPTLAIGKYTWTNDWPVISVDWITNSTKEIMNVGSGLVWEDFGCIGTQHDPIIQNTWNDLICQKWDFTQLGNGYYKITCGKGDLSVESLGCTGNNGTKLDLNTYWSGACQIWHVEQNNKGNYVISSKNGNRVIGVPASVTGSGNQTSLMDYNGQSNQQWTISETSKTNTKVFDTQSDFNDMIIIPNPVTDGLFKVNLGSSFLASNLTINIFNIEGRKIYSKTIYNNSDQIQLNVSLKAGVYFITSQNSKTIMTKQFFVK